MSISLGLLDRYLWRQLRDLFAFGVAIFTTLLMVNHLFLLARLVLQRGASLGIAFELLLYRLPYFVAFSFPMAMLLATLISIGRLSDGQEITAMRTSGISLARITASVVAAGLLVSLGTLVVNETVVPGAEDRYRVAIVRSLESPAAPEQQQVLFREIQNGVESVYFVRNFRTEGRMEGVVVDQFERGELRRVIEAAHGRYTGGGWEFLDGTMYLFVGPAATVTTRFKRLQLGLNRTPEEIAVPQKQPSEMSIRELRAYIAVLRRAGENPIRYAVEVQSKLSVPMSALLFGLLAVPLGLRPHRTGASVGVGLTILVLLGYYIMISITLTLGQGGWLDPVPAAWLPNVALAVAGWLLLRRAER